MLRKWDGKNIMSRTQFPGRLVTPYEPTVLSLTDQVNSFLNTAGKKPTSAPWTSANTLVSFWIGINDIGNSYSNSGNRSALVMFLGHSLRFIHGFFQLFRHPFERVFQPCFENLCCGSEELLVRERTKH